VLDDVDEIVASCRKRLSVMRRCGSPNSPDGFVVVDGAGYEVRRWFERENDRSGSVLL
jgi:hypothetical protein